MRQLDLAKLIKVDSAKVSRYLSGQAIPSPMAAMRIWLEIGIEPQEWKEQYREIVDMVASLSDAHRSTSRKGKAS